MKRIAALGGVCLILLGTAACHVTPAEEFVQQKDQERAIEQALATASAADNGADSMQPDTTQDFYMESDDGRLRVSMPGVPIAVPDEALPITRVSLGSFSDDEAAAVVQMLLGSDAFLQEGPAQLTKSDIEELIVRYKGYIASGTVNETTVYTPEELAEEIARLEKEYDAAPEESADPGPQRFDGTMYPKSDALRGVDATNADESSLLSIVSPEDPGSPDAMCSVFYLQDKDASPDESVGRDAAVGETFPETGLSFDDAIEECLAFLAAAGVPDALPASQRLVDLGHGPAYEFQFVRTVNGLPAAFFQSTYEPEEDGTVPWDYERITIAVDASGIDSMYWTNRTETGEVLGEDVQVLPYEDAQKVFEKMIGAVYEPQTEWLSDDQRIEVTVDDVQLAPIRIREVNTEGRDGLYVPAWLYYGRVSNPAEKASVLGPDDRRLILAVNAVDGSVIDLRRGY